MWERGNVDLALVDVAVAVDTWLVAGACCWVLLFLGCNETCGHSARFEVYGVPRWSVVPASGMKGVYKCEGCRWLEEMLESKLASDVERLKMGDTWSGEDIHAWWVLPDPLEAMVKVS